MLHIYVSNRAGEVKYGTTGKPVPGYDIRLIDDDDFCTRPRHPDHLLDRAHLVGEEVDPAYVKDAVEDLHLEREPLSFSLKEVCVTIPLAQITLALPQHSP